MKSSASLAWKRLLHSPGLHLNFACVPYVSRGNRSAGNPRPDPSEPSFVVQRPIFLPRLQQYQRLVHRTLLVFVYRGAFLFFLASIAGVLGTRTICVGGFFLLSVRSGMAGGRLVASLDGKCAAPRRLLVSHGHPSRCVSLGLHGSRGFLPRYRGRGTPNLLSFLGMVDGACRIFCVRLAKAETFSLGHAFELGQAVAIPLLVAGTVVRSTWVVSRLLENKGLRWIGRISYAAPTYGSNFSWAMAGQTI